MMTSKIAIRSLRAAGLGLGLALIGPGVPARGADGPAPDRGSEGRELFHREWTPGDPRSPHGDGLGPVFNDSSCVACHNSGGSGGGGPSSKNVDIVTAVFNGVVQQQANAPAPVERPAPPPGYLQRAAMSLLGIEASRPAAAITELSPAPPPKPNTAKLIDAHPGFRTARSVVLHKSSVDPGYLAWRAMITGMNQVVPAAPELSGPAQAEAEILRIRQASQFESSNMRPQVQLGDFELVHSQRNPMALFGIGLMDAIPDSVIEAAARVKYPDFPEVAGRVARQKNGKIGRFGWKAQTPSLNDFVLTACAVELGLEVPGHPQGGLPSPSLKTATQSVCKVELAVEGAALPLGQKLTLETTPLDLTAAQCASLESYIRDLPAPVELNRADREVEAGRLLFAKVGCATCHSPRLGEVDGLYSDMLVHDMGPELGDTGSYTPFVPGSQDPEFVDPPISDTVAEAGPASVTNLVGLVVPKAITGPANRQEWRTPPLWGVRDSSPYLHDGRAATLDGAIALHGGQGERSSKAYFGLTPRERLQVQSFLKSLAAPDSKPTLARR